MTLKATSKPVSKHMEDDTTSTSPQNGQDAASVSSLNVKGVAPDDRPPFPPGPQGIATSSIWGFQVIQ